MPEIPRWSAHTPQGDVHVVIDATGLFLSEEARQEYYAAFARRRGETPRYWDFTPPEPDQVKAAEEYLRKCPPARTSRSSSYDVRRWAERWSLAVRGPQISTGALLLAAVRVGLMLDLRDAGPNCVIYVSRRHAEAIAKQAELEQTRRW